MSAALERLTFRTRMPWRSGSPTARRMREATAAGATATPRRGATPSSGSKKPSQASSCSAKAARASSGRPAARRSAACVVGRARRLDELAPAVGQRDGDRAAVLGVGLARDEAGALQAREADAHRARRPAHLRHQLALGQRVALGVEQGREDLEARAREVVLGQRLLELGLEVGGGGEDAVDEGGGIGLLEHLASPKGLSPSNLAKRFRPFVRTPDTRVAPAAASANIVRNRTKGAAGMESSAPARVLVVAHKTAATPALLDAVRERAARGPREFTLLVPNAAHGLHVVVDAEDQDSNEAEQVLELAIPLLEEAAGGPVEGMVGDPSPMNAIQDAINIHGFDEVIISTLPTTVSKWLKLDLPSKVSGLGLPVTTVTAKARRRPSSRGS